MSGYEVAAVVVAVGVAFALVVVALGWALRSEPSPPRPDPALWKSTRTEKREAPHAD